MLFSRVKREKKGNEQPMVECDGNVINWCENEKCEVKCGDGTEVSCWLAGVCRYNAYSAGEADLC